MTDEATATPGEAAPVCPDCPITEDELPNGISLQQRIGLHRRYTHGYVNPEGKAAKKGRPRQPRDSAPRTVNVQVGPRTQTKKRDEALAQVEERAKGFAGMVAAGLFLMNMPDDAAAIEIGKGPWAMSVANLAEYEEWLKKLLSGGGDTSGRVMAWVQFLMATGALVSPILLHHGILSGPLAQILAAGQAEVSIVAPTGEPAGEPAAA